MKKEKHRLSFKIQLLLAGLLLVSLVAIPVLAIEVQRPWQALNNAIDKGNIVLAQLKSNFTEDELLQMNNFALKIAELDPQYNEDYLIWTFNLLLEKNSLPSEKELKSILQQNKIEVPDFDYSQLQLIYGFWQKQFFAEPDTLKLFRNSKKLLLQSVKSINAANFIFDDIYIMTDNSNQLVFLVDGANWHESSYPGLEYDVIDNNCPEFRNYLTNGPGYAASPKYYYWHLFPKFDTDQWGTWYSVWYAHQYQGIYNNFALDFDASSIKYLMEKIATSIAIIALLILLVTSLLAAKLSRIFSEPIQHLVAGAEAVIQNNYDHVIPDSSSQEFSTAINVFNRMIKMLKERLNLKNTLEKLLSKDLAEQVAKHGLVLGGQKVEVSNLFTDFAGFSTITQKMNPEDIVNLLNEYFEMLIPIIKKWGGFPDKFIGDAIVVIFGAPVPLDNHAENAVACAIEMQKCMRQFNDQRKNQGKTVLEMRLGINSGEVIAGAIGSNLKLEYTSIGETTNLANRMEASCQIGHILISQNTYNLISHIFFEGVDIDESPQHFQVKGYELEQAAYNIYVSTLTITKEAQSVTAASFYTYKDSNQKLKHFESLSPDRKLLFKKVIDIVI